MTLINKGDDITFELTPFREEGGYEDHRHPDEIKWSSSLLSDAKRRDFTINCIYYTTVQFANSPSVLSTQKGTDKNTESIIPSLSTQG